VGLNRCIVPALAREIDIWDICTMLVLVLTRVWERVIPCRWRGPLPLEGTLVGHSTVEVGS